MGGHPDLVQDLGDGDLVAGRAAALGRRAGGPGHPADKAGLVEGFEEVEGKAAVQQFLLQLLVLERPRDVELGVAALLLVALLHRDGVQLGHEGVQQHRLGPLGAQRVQRRRAVLLAHVHLHALGLQGRLAGSGAARAGIRHQEFDRFHFSSPPNCVFPLTEPILPYITNLCKTFFRSCATIRAALRA